MIRDCVIFSNEVDLLKKRLEYYNNVVDEFVIVESNKNFYGEPRDLVFPTINDGIEQYLHKIKYVVCENFEKIEKGIEYSWGNGPWANETRIRETLNSIVETANNDDIFIISDVDEFYNKELIKDYGEPVTFMMTNNYFYVDYLQYQNTNYAYIAGPQLFTKQNYFDFKDSKWDGHESHLYSIQGMRNSSMTGFKRVIYDNAWHFSYFGGIDVIKNKIKNFSHAEFITYLNKDNNFFIDKIHNFEDIYGRDFTYKNENNLTEELNNLFSDIKYKYKAK